MPTQATTTRRSPKKTTDVKQTKNPAPSVSPEIQIYNLDGSVKESIAVPSDIFAATINKPLVAQYVRVYLTNQRQGTVSTKSRGEVVGTTKKIYRQKGTGGARHGSKKAPIFVGGGVAFGPKPRDFALKITKKQRVLALVSSISSQFKNKNIIVLVEDVSALEPKTSKLFTVFKALKVQNENILFVAANEYGRNLNLASRNMKNVTLARTNNINAYEVLNAQKIIFTEKSLSSFIEKFKHAV